MNISSIIIKYGLCNYNLMNKLAIPALLLGVVMIAGAFAFMPVQEASTVHLSAATSTATSDQVLNPFLVQTAAVVTAAGGQLTATFTCTAGESCVIYDARVALTVNPGATADVFFIESITVNGLSLTGADFGEPANDTFVVGAAGGVKGIPADIVTNAAFALNVPASVMGTLAAVGSNVGGTPITLDGGDTMTVVVQSSGGDTSTSQITFYGAMTGATDPAVPTYA